MKSPQISRLTTNRLSLYLRCLTLLQEAGVRTVSSRELAEQFHLNSAQIRKDLAHFGEFGVRGVGYRIAHLRRHLVRILGLNRGYNVVILGAGHLGLALAGYRGFYTEGFRIAALVDSSEERVRELKTGRLSVFPLRQLGRIVRTRKVEIAILAVPAAAGQSAFQSVYDAGVRAVLNFVPVRLKVPADCEVVTVDLKIQLESLAYHLARADRRPPARALRSTASSGRGAPQRRARRNALPKRRPSAARRARRPR